MKELTKKQEIAFCKFNDAVAKNNDDYCMNNHPDFRKVAKIPTHPCHKEAVALVKALEE